MTTVPRRLLSGPMLAGIGVLVVVLVVAVVLLRGSGSPGPIGALGSPTSSAAASEGTTASARQTSGPISSCAASPGATPSPTAGSFAIGQPRAGDDTTAFDLVTRYEQALVAGQWQTAWAMLAPEQQALSGPFAAYTYDRSAYFKSVAGRYTVNAPTHDLATIRRWVVPDNYPVNPIWPASPDYNRAFVVEVDYPLIAQFNALDVLLAAPDKCDRWWLWALR